MAQEIEYRKCAGTCGQFRPATVLGSDGRCLDCRMAPTANYVPPLSATQQRKRAGLPRWSGYKIREDDY